jgi:hypothetical protein
LILAVDAAEKVTVLEVRVTPVPATDVGVISSKPVGFCAGVLGITHAVPFQIRYWFVST